MSDTNKNKGCGCANIPISVIILFIGGSFWAVRKYGLPKINVSQINSALARVPGIEIQIPVDEPPTPTPTLPPSIASSPELPPTPELDVETNVATKPETAPITKPLPKTDWEKKQTRGIYLSRYQITNNASEQMIRNRVKYYKSQGINTIIHGVWKSMKQANPNVSFDLCHHNPYWAKRYFAADWKNWGVDRVFIQNYNEKNFNAELDYVKKHDGIAITDKQFHRLPEIIKNKQIESVLIFALSGKPEQTAAKLKSLTEK